MDCDKFERVLLDLLYDDLDELTRAAANRHKEQCQRCRSLLSRFRATREVGVIPLENPPDTFESQVMLAERQAHLALPLRIRLARHLTIIGGYAMRPQITMGALALLMIGSSLVFLRPPSGHHGASSVQVTERGIPRPEPEAVVVPIDEVESAVGTEAEPEAVPPAEPEPAKPEPTLPSATGPELPERTIARSEEELELARQRAEDRAYTTAMAAFQSANHQAAQLQFDSIVEAGGRNAAAAELYASLAAEQVSGCSAALPRFDSVAAKYPHQHLGHTAIWHSASCRSRLGLNRRAGLDLQRLLKVPAFAQKARAMLIEIEGRGGHATSDREPPEPPSPTALDPSLVPTVPTQGAAAGEPAPQSEPAPQPEPDSTAP